MTAAASNLYVRHEVGWLTALAPYLVLAAFGCNHETTNIATIRPLNTAYPVSASSSYVDDDGAIVDEQRYSVVRSFVVEKNADAPRHSTAETPISLKPDFDRIVAETGADAITRVTIEPDEYDVGSHDSAAGAKNLMYPLLVFGLAIDAGALIKLGNDPHEGRWQGLLVFGAIVTGIGALLWGSSALDSEPARWHFKIRGDAVKVQATPSPPVGPESTNPRHAASPAGA
jgi:hypothetical protein